MMLPLVCVANCYIILLFLLRIPDCLLCCCWFGFDAYLLSILHSAGPSLGASDCLFRYSLIKFNMLFYAPKCYPSLRCSNRTNALNRGPIKQHGSTVHTVRLCRRIWESRSHSAEPFTRRRTSSSTTGAGTPSATPTC